MGRASGATDYRILGSRFLLFLEGEEAAHDEQTDIQATVPYEGRRRCRRDARVAGRSASRDARGCASGSPPVCQGAPFQSAVADPGQGDGGDAQHLPYNPASDAADVAPTAGSDYGLGL